MSIIQQILDAALDENASVSSLLLKCKVLASRIGDPALTAWVESELGGYQDRNNLPEYRVLPAVLRASGSNVAWKVTGQEIPIYALPEHLRHMVDYIKYTSDITSIESLRGRDVVAFNAPTNVRWWIENKGGGNINVNSVYLEVSGSAIDGMLGAIRTRIVDSVLRVEREYPNLTDQQIRTDPEVKRTVADSFSIAVHGGSPIFTFGTGQIEVTQDNRSIVAGDLDSLHSYLRDQGIAGEDLTSLDKVLRDEDALQEILEGRGRLADWAATASEKVTGKAGSVAYEVVKQVAVKAVMTYLGLS